MQKMNLAALRGARLVAGLTAMVGAAVALVCTGTTSNSSNFNGTLIPGGDYIWFNANFSAKGVPNDGVSTTTLQFTNSKIDFVTEAGAHVTVPVPNATIMFVPGQLCGSTGFSGTSWLSHYPPAGSDEMFLTGVAYHVPSSFKVSGKVNWTGTLSVSNGASTPVSVNWKWGAAVYSQQFDGTMMGLNVKAMHSNACTINNGDHAGTPENALYKPFVTGGGTGGGGSNWTGSWSGTASVPLTCTSCSDGMVMDNGGHCCPTGQIMGGICQG